MLCINKQCDGGGGGGGARGGAVFSLLGATSDLALPVPSWADTTNGAFTVQ